VAAEQFLLGKALFLIYYSTAVIPYPGFPAKFLDVPEFIGTELLLAICYQVSCQIVF
jgi:hypothetical protein